MIQKRIADILEKMSVAFFVGAYFQNNPVSAAGAVIMGFSVFALCLDMTRRMK